MKALPNRIAGIAVVLVFIASAYGNPGRAEAEYEKGRSAYLKHNYAKAEKHFRALVAAEPDSWFGHLYLGHSLYYQEKYGDAIPAYEKAMQFGENAEGFDLSARRLLTDQLGMSYGISGRLQDAKALFQAAIGDDPEYALYYYNLACTHAELDELDDALLYLRGGFERRDNMLPGESFPNPREDESFKRFLGNPQFEAAMKELGF